LFSISGSATNFCFVRIFFSFFVRGERALGSE
jgi:hypothetical protein